MTGRWTGWAREALRRMDEPNWKPRQSDADGEAEARAALQGVASKGYEPYHTLKVFVYLNRLDETEGESE